MDCVDEESVPESRGLSERVVKWKVRWGRVPQALVAKSKQRKPSAVLKKKRKAMTIKSRGVQARWRNKSGRSAMVVQRRMCQRGRLMKIGLGMGETSDARHNARGRTPDCYWTRARRGKDGQSGQLRELALP